MNSRSGMIILSITLLVVFSASCRVGGAPAARGVVAAPVALQHDIEKR